MAGLGEENQLGQQLRSQLVCRTSDKRRYRWLQQGCHYLFSCLILS